MVQAAGRGDDVTDEERAEWLENLSRVAMTDGDGRETLRRAAHALRVKGQLVEALRGLHDLARARRPGKHTKLGRACRAAAKALQDASPPCSGVAERLAFVAERAERAGQVEPSGRPAYVVGAAALKAAKETP